MPTDNPFAYLLDQPEGRRRKRGGLAGIWDRNKGALGSVAGAALGNIIAPGIGTYLGGALGGAAARGRLDERAVGDAFTGAGGASAVGGLKRLLGGGAAQAASAGAAPAVPSVVPLPDAASASGIASPMAAAGRGRGLSGVLNFAKQNPEAVGAGLQAASGILGSQAERRMQNERIRLERERDQVERRRRETIAALLMPQFSPDTFGRR